MRFSFFRNTDPLRCGSGAARPREAILVNGTVAAIATDLSIWENVVVPKTEVVNNPKIDREQNSSAGDLGHVLGVMLAVEQASLATV